MYLVFRNKVVVAVALNETEARELACESEASVGASSRVLYRIVKVESSAFLEDVLDRDFKVAVPFHSPF
jgi:hypothetical protein